jgi:hypothetical protein
VISRGELEVVVATVLVKPASGRKLGPSSRITAESLPEFLPDRGEAETVARELAAAGFEVGPLVGIGMSIAGPRELFEQFFGTPITAAEEGGWAIADGTTRELPLHAVPEEIAERVHAVTFEPPVETATP